MSLDHTSLAILFERMFVVINFTSDTRLVLACRGQRVSEGNTTVGRVETISSVRLCTAQYTGQERCTQREISGRKALNSTQYRMKMLDTAQRTGKKDMTQYEILNKNLHTAQYTAQKRCIRHNTWTSALYSTLNGTKNALHCTI